MLDRIDKILVQLGLAETRTKASDLIKKKCVFYKEELILKPSYKVNLESTLEDFKIKTCEKFVGRGAYKLEGATNFFKVSIEGKTAVDVGASTGGFTDFLLQSGAEKVIAIDVGHHQLAKALRVDKRVVNLEGTNIRYGVSKYALSCDLAVVDISFISLKLVLQEIFNLVKDDGELVILVKPQFEVGRSGLSKNGLVKNDDLRRECLEDLYDFSNQNGLFIKNIMKSVIEGKKSGNTEYFFHFHKSLENHLFKKEDIKNLF